MLLAGDLIYGEPPDDGQAPSPEIIESVNDGAGTPNGAPDWNSPQEESYTTNKDSPLIITTIGGDTIAYTPPDFKLQDTFEYIANNDLGGCVYVRYSAPINLVPVANNPVANDDTYSVPEHGVVFLIAGPTLPRFNLLDNDFDGNAIDVPPQVLQVTKINGNNVFDGQVIALPNSLLKVFADGTFNFDPHPGYVGVETFEYSIGSFVDGAPTGEPCATARVKIEVVGYTPREGYEPVGVTDTYDTVEDTPLIVDIADNQTDTVAANALPVGVLGNDDDANLPPGTALSAILFGQGRTTAGGTVSLNSDGTFGYTPPVNFNGIDTFTYVAHVSDPQSPPTFLRSIDRTRVIINVAPAPDNPVANDDVYYHSIPPPGVFVLRAEPTSLLANDYDADADDVPPQQLRITQINGGAVSDGQVVQLSHGSLHILANGRYYFSPASEFVGVQSFQYTVQSFIGDTPTGEPGATARVYIGIGIDIRNPIGKADTYATNEDTPLFVEFAGNQTGGGSTYLQHTGVLDNDTDLNPTGFRPGAGLSAVLVGGGVTSAGGRIELGSDGTFVYTPPANFNGMDTFQYIAKDNERESSPTNVTINVTAIPDDPVANDDSYSVRQWAIPRLIRAPFPPPPSLLDNDFDGDSSDVPPQVLHVTQINGRKVSDGQLVALSNGLLTIHTDGTFFYDPNPEFVGVETFEYAIGSFAGGTSTGEPEATAQVEIEVGAIFPWFGPSAGVSDRYITIENTPLVVDEPGVGATASQPVGVLANDKTADLPAGAILVAELVSQGRTSAGGTVDLNLDGTFTYTPPADFTGIDTFHYFANINAELRLSNFLSLASKTRVTIEVLPGFENAFVTAISDSSSAPNTLGIVESLVDDVFTISLSRDFDAVDYHFGELGRPPEIPHLAEFFSAAGDTIGGDLHFWQYHATVDPRSPSLAGYHENIAHQRQRRHDNTYRQRRCETHSQRLGRNVVADR